MAKQFRRWYEKNEYLKAFMNLMSTLDIETQSEMAVDIILKSSDMIDRDYAKIVKDVANFNPKKYKRWYDKNPNIHVAIENLRELEPEQIEEVIKIFPDEILNSSEIFEELV